PVRPSCGACEISRPRQPRPPTSLCARSIIHDVASPSGGRRNATVIWMRISVEIDLCYGYRGDACRCGREQQRVE
ncbi:hypothetical protein, partial [Paramuribaculum intestinale]|uniref:hypothetical protein n=1 Tax=Paramuribaculum intestinale TaxID=2094151 RepID=UPI0025B73310